MNPETIEIEIDPIPSADPTMPAWLATLIAAIGAIVPIPPDVALRALQALCAPYAKGGAERARVDALSPIHRAAMRAAYDLAWTAIERARMAPPATEAAPPVMEAAPPPVAPPPVAPPATEAAPVFVSPMVHPATWVPLMREGAGCRPQTAQERRAKVSPDVWGARTALPVGTVAPGALVRIERRYGGSQVRVLVAVVATEGDSVIATVREATEADMAPRPRIAADSAPVVAPPARPEGAMSLSAMMPETTAERALERIATEGATIATPERATVEPTERGNGITVDSGASIGIFERPRAERVFRPEGAATRTVAARTERARLLAERDLIAGAIAADGWLQVSWTGEGSTEHGKILDAMIAIDREHDAPGIPSAEHYTGLAVDVLRGRDWDVKRLHKRDTPQGVKARWLVGRALGGDRAAVPGDAYGTAVLFVDLVMTEGDEGALRFEGDPRLAETIRSEYTASVASVALTSRVLTPWLGRILRTRHGAVKRGHVWYVPPGHGAEVRRLIEAIAPLWGDHETINVTTGPDLFASLTRGLLVEAQKVAAEFAIKTVEAKDAAREKAATKARERRGATDAFCEAEGEAAHKRATIGPVIASRLLREIGTVAARVTAYETVLGPDSTREAVAIIASLRTSLEPLTDDTSLRGAMLELS